MFEVSAIVYHVKTRTFPVGQCVMLEELTVAYTRLWLHTQVLEPSFYQVFLNTCSFLTCLNQSQFQAVSGEVKLCEKMTQFDA